MTVELSIDGKNIKQYIREKYGVYNFRHNGFIYVLTINEFFNTLTIVNPENDIRIHQITNNLPKIIDHLRENLNEEQFKEVEKFCFERI